MQARLANVGLAMDVQVKYSSYKIVKVSVSQDFPALHIYVFFVKINFNKI